MVREGDYYPDEDSREDSPLLARHEDTEGQATPKAPVTPLPRAQFVTICAIKLMVPVAHTQVLPYVSKMIAGFDLPDARSVGYYTGLLAFASTAGQFLTIYAWGRVSGVLRVLFI